MRKPPLPFMLIAFSFFSILFSGLNVVQHKKIWSGDETISYLCATGNQEQFRAVAEQNRTQVQQATVWESLLTIHSPYCFQQIATDLSLSDLHPPLYFWILHVYLILFGFSMHAGIVLNLVFHILSLFVLHALTRKSGFSQTASAAVCLLWSVSPAALTVDFYARQYALLSLVNLLYAYCFLLWYTKPTKVNVLALVLVCALGFLTHYSFIYLGAGYGLYAILNFRATGIRNLIALTTTFVVAGLCLFLFHPHFTDQFVLQQQRAQDFDLLNTGARIGKTVLSFLNFGIPLLLLKPFLLKLSNTQIWSMVISCFLLLSIAIWLTRYNLKSRYQHMFSGLKKPNLYVWMTIWMTVVTIIPYLLCVTPFHAMGAPYLVCIYPFMAILLYRIIRSSRAALLISLLVMISGSIISLVIFKNQQASYTPLIDSVKKSDRIFYDIADRRNVGRLAPFFSKHAEIHYLPQGERPSMNLSYQKTIVLISAYEKPEKLQSNQQYYDFGDHGGFVVWKPARE